MYMYKYLRLIHLHLHTEPSREVKWSLLLKYMYMYNTCAVLVVYIDYPMEKRSNCTWNNLIVQVRMHTVHCMWRKWAKLWKRVRRVRRSYLHVHYLLYRNEDLPQPRTSHLSARPSQLQQTSQGKDGISVLQLTHPWVGLVVKTSGSVLCFVNECLPLCSAPSVLSCGSLPYMYMIVQYWPVDVQSCTLCVATCVKVTIFGNAFTNTGLH